MATLDNTTITTPEINGSYDGGMAVKQYTSLIINNTVSTSHYGRGLTIYVRGNCVINGTLTVKPSNAVSGGTGTIASGGVNYPIITSGSGTLNALEITGLGSEATTIMPNQNVKLSGKTGINFHLDKTAAAMDGVNETGSGGLGGGEIYGDSPCPSVDPLAGRGFGLAFGGGGGGGGGPGCHGGNQQERANTATTAGQVGAALGCHGGGGGGGGAGLPAGAGGSAGGSGGTTSTKNGCLFLIVGGDLTGSGSIDLRGANGGAGGNGTYGGGGGAGSGGGVCYIAVKGTNSFCATTTGTQTGTHSGGTGNILLSAGSGGAGGSGSYVGCAGQDGTHGYTKVVAMD